MIQKKIIEIQNIQLQSFPKCLLSTYYVPSTMTNINIRLQTHINLLLSCSNKHLDAQHKLSQFIKSGHFFFSCIPHCQIPTQILSWPGLGPQSQVYGLCQSF